MVPYLNDPSSFRSATTMKSDRVNISACASLWPIIDCLLAPSPRVKQKSRLLKNLLKLQVSHCHLLISVIRSTASQPTIQIRFALQTGFVLQEWVGEALTVKFIEGFFQVVSKWWPHYCAGVTHVTMMVTAKIWLDTKHSKYKLFFSSHGWQSKSYFLGISALTLEWNNFIISFLFNRSILHYVSYFLTNGRFLTGHWCGIVFVYWLKPLNHLLSFPHPSPVSVFLQRV